MGWIILAVIVFYLALSFALFHMACHRKGKTRGKMAGIAGTLDEQSARYAEETAPAIAWLSRQRPETVSIKAFDGIELKASMYENPAPAGVLVACHGYRSSGLHDFSSAIRFYYDRGFSVLLIDQRACGRSGGTYITFGQLERFDAQSWCRWAEENRPGHKILLAGISLGGATVMMAADALPDAVAGILADCGFDSAWGEIDHSARQYFHLSAAPFYPGMEFWARSLGRFRFRAVRASEALAKWKKPLLLVHGEADTFVPPENSRLCFKACAGDAALLTVPEADHGMSFLVDHEGYVQAVDEFLRKCGFSVKIKENVPDL